MRTGRHQQAPGRAPSSPAAAAEPLPEGFVACPVCGMTLKEGSVNIHLDQCLSKQMAAAAAAAVAAAPPPAAAPLAARLGRQPPRAAAGRPAGGSRAGSKGASKGAAAGGAEALEVPSKLCYHLLTDAQMRKQLRKVGLPLDGKRVEWQERYQNYRWGGGLLRPGVWSGPRRAGG
jgi:hypothetical protein